MKKSTIFFVALGCLVAGASFFFSSKRPDLSSNAYCPFCDSKVLERQMFYEDDLVIAMTTHKPISPGHCLVIPKRHVVRFELLSEEEIAHIGEVIKKVNTAAVRAYGISPYLLLQKNGEEVGQTVAHVHFHYIPRKAGEGATLAFMLQMFLANAKPPISEEENRAAVEKMKQAI